MSSKPRTIDNLGIDASIRYAKDKELFEAKYLEESQFVSRQAEVPVYKPYIRSELETLFSSLRTTNWALFTPPPEAFLQEDTLFSYQLIPSLGTYEKEEEREKILEEAFQKDSSDPGKKKKEKKTIQELLACLEKIDRSLQLINARRNQYQRG